MIPNLPKPKIHNTEQHSYISISDLLQFVFAFGYELQPILPYDFKTLPVTRSDQCKRAQEFLQTVLSSNDNKLNDFIIIMTDWHDDFEPNTQAKQNRGSVWTYTITLLSSAHILNQSSYSYVIAIGPKNANHDNVLDTIRKEIKSLQQSTISIYHRVLDSMILVRLFSSFVNS